MSNIYCSEKTKTMTSAKPFVKWAGGKSQLLAEIRAKYPQRVERYCEPFVCIDPPYRPLTQTARSGRTMPST